MKALALALVLCTLIVCAAHYGLPFITQQRELALAERRQTVAERQVNVIFALPAAPGPARHGLRAAGPEEGILP